ncbi:MAG: extracellular solute-binding protein, partial [Clostridia bacterium]|nr:extracellular solute-binding protein [Clostridia bacterium]
MKKLVVILLALATLLSFASCGPKEPKKAEKVALENVYLTKKLPTPDGVDFYGIIMSGDKVYFNGSKEVKTTDEYGNEISDWYDCFYVGNSDMTDIHEAFSFKSEYGYNEEEGYDYGKYLNGYNPGRNGTLWLSFTDYKSRYDEDIDEYIHEEKSTLKRLNPDGSFTDELDVSTILDNAEGFDGDTYSKYLGQTFETEDGKLVTTVGGQYILVLNADGTFMSLEKFPDDKYPSDMAIIDSDTLRLTAWDWTGNESKVEIIDYSFSKKEFNTIDTISTYYSVQMADDGVIYTNDSNVISKYDFEKKELVPLLDFINSDINSDRLGQYYPAGNDEFYAFEYDNNYEERNLIHLTPAAKGEVVEKYIITLAANGLDAQLKSMIIDYNRSSKDYRIAVKIYGWEEKDTEQFDLDLMSGNTPDIICIDSNFNISKYATKGILADMGKYLSEDKEITRDTILPNILEMCDANGKIYNLPVSFAIRSIMMKKSIVGDRTSLTFGDVNEILKTFPDSVYLREIDRPQLETSFLPIILEDFIDYKNGKSNFTDGSFAEYLEFAKTFPAKIDFENLYMDFDDSDWEDYENAFKENRVLANVAYISRFET